MRTLLACGLLLCLTTTLWAAAPSNLPPEVQSNWHQWRGPLATGVAPQGNPPVEWDETKNIRWKVKIPGHSTATPIVWGDQVFTITAIKTDREGEAAPAPEPPKEEQKEQAREGAPPRIRGFRNVPKPTNFYQFVVMSVDRKTGETRWQHMAREEVPHEAHHPDGSFASASPMTDGKHLYVSFGSRGVYCYDLDGNQKWSRDLGRMIIFNTFGEGSSPVVHGDAVVLNWDHQAGSFIICLDANTGETRWKVDRDENTTWATPLVIDHNGRTQVIVHGSTRVRSYDLKTGEQIWACGGQAMSAIPCPISDGERVFAMTGFMGNALYAIPLDATGDITNMDDKIAWKRKESGTPYVPSPLLYDGVLYFTSSNKGILSSIDAKTGKPIIDRQRLQGIQNVYASPVGAADRIYITSREGNTVVLKRAGELEILATNKLDDRFDASAAIVGNQIFMRGNEHLYCIAAE